MNSKHDVLLKACEVLSKPLPEITFKECNNCGRKISKQMRTRKHLKFNIKGKKYVYVCKYGCSKSKTD